MTQAEWDRMTGDEQVKFLIPRINRFSHYAKLGWFAYDEITVEILGDEELWEKAKDLPIDPNNPENVLGRELREIEKLEGVEREKAIEEFKRKAAKHLNKRDHGRLT